MDIEKEIDEALIKGHILESPNYSKGKLYAIFFC